MALNPERVFRVIREYKVPNERVRFGRTLFITRDEKLDVSGPDNTRTFRTKQAVTSFFSSDSEGYRAGSAFFEQQLNNVIIMARWNGNNEVLGTYAGTGTVASVADIKAAMAGNITFLGKTITIGASAFATDTSYSDIATTLQGLIQAAGAPFDAATVTYADSKFTIGGISQDPLDNKVGGNLYAALLGLDSGVSTGYQPAEQIDDFLARMIAEDVLFDFITLEYTGTDKTQGAADQTRIANFVKGRDIRFIAEFNENDAIGGVTPFSTGDGTSPAYVFSQLEIENTAYICDKTSTQDYKSVRFCSAFAGVNYFGTDTFLNAKLMPMPGAKPTSLTEDEADAVLAKRGNFFTKYGPNARFAEGYTCKPNAYLDSSIGMQWLAKALNDDLWSLRDRTPNLAGISGINKMHDALTPTLNAARESNFLTGGVLNEDSIAEYRDLTGDEDFDGRAPLGYILYTEPLSSRGVDDIQQRIAPDTYIFVNLNDPYHSATLRLIGREGGSEIEVSAGDDTEEEETA